MQIVSLDGIWKMHKEGETRLVDAVVPGSVLSALMAAGEIPNPYEGMNEYEVRDLFYEDYTFEREFTVSDEISELPLKNLVCEGIDTLSDIYINDVKILHTDNMHRTYRISVGEHLCCGENRIKVCLHSPLSFVEHYQPGPMREISYIPSGGIKGDQYLRKTHSMLGWDWGAQLPDEGIWRSIYIEAYDRARISEARFHQIHENGEVTLQIHVKVQKHTPGRYKVSAQVAPSYYNGARLPRVEVQAMTSLLSEDRDELTMTIRIEKPRLWWPNGFGDQNLYDVTLSLKGVGMLSGGGAAALEITKIPPLDEKTYTIGLRTLTISTKQDEDGCGAEFAPVVNGVKIFAMGANYIPEDCVYSNITKERIETLTDSAKKANYNMLRVWGGGYYPSEEFYMACDKKGLMVWQDFMFACNMYELTEEFESSVRAEIEDNVKRLRHHACLTLWCGNNEIESAWNGWPGFKGGSAYLKADYIKLFEKLIPEVLREQDDVTFYWPSSPSSGGCFDKPDDPSRGDMHYWDVWHGMKPFSDYQNRLYRFMSEFGFQSLPDLKTIRSFAGQEDLNLFSPVMESHQKNDSANGKMMTYIADNFRYPKDFGSVVYVTQILQGLAVKSGVEHWRRHRGLCMGTLYWQINDNWPVASWSSVDYYGRWKLLHYMARNFYAPIAGSIVKTHRKPEDTKSVLEISDAYADDTGIKAYVQNESRFEATVKLTLSLKTMDFEVLSSREVTQEVAPLSSALLLEEDYAKLLKAPVRAILKPEDRRAQQELKLPSEVFVEAVYEITSQGVTTRQVEAEVLLAYKHMNLPRPEFDFSVRKVDSSNEKKQSYQIELCTNCFAPFVMLEIEGADVVFSDNGIMMTDRESRIITFSSEDLSSGRIESEEDLQRRLRIRSLRDTY